MDSQTLNISIFYTLMGFVLDFFVSLIRGIVNISFPIYDHNNRCIKPLYQKELNTVWLQEKQLLDTKVVGNIETDAKMLLQTLKPPQLEFYSIEYISRSQIYNDSVDSESLTEKNTVQANDNEIESENCDSLNELYDVCSEPTFCYFFVDVRPRKRTNRFNASQSYNEAESSICDCSSTDMNTNIKRNCTTCQVFKDVYSSKEGLEDKNTCTIFPSRQRNTSECSEDSFICFMEDDGDDEADNIPAAQLYQDTESETDNSDDDDAYDYINEEYSDDEDNCKNYVQEKSTDCHSNSNIKKVRFNSNPEIHVMHTWDFAYRSARKGEWQIFARDRVRFQQRIQRTAAILDPVLSPQHRQKILDKRCQLSIEGGF